MLYNHQQSMCLITIPYSSQFNQNKEIGIENN